MAGRTVMDKRAALEAADQKTNAWRIQTGKVVVNLGERVVSVDDQRGHLTGKEYGILELLSMRKGTIVTKAMFFNHLYGGMDEPETQDHRRIRLQTTQETCPGDRPSYLRPGAAERVFGYALRRLVCHGCSGASPSPAC